MKKRAVLLGDTGHHGGAVITASSSFTNNGVHVALDGDLYSCPRKGHGISAIMASGGAKSNGRAIALTGDTTGCGCILVGRSTFVYLTKD